ncbi:ribonuclease III [Candidatus Methylacidithermus pantelleriae]|uniref:Ribonuclease 3 n=1 Tax=Candidatus Methylacidithermus pantelleriae TaxID=2744239 RepID=A0A8J2BIP6_9BACT|nr:ribonuclease III [Candidatus Methylacidithermus pantelleriae]CAF0694631.1 Ribonuclease 3 [Candidatus Methylacidithermus pantelleriae]
MNRIRPALPPGWARKVAGLEKRLGYRFANRLLLRQALTHPSYLPESKEEVGDNQRLEFLGDAVLQLVVTEEAYHRLPEEPEGVLTHLRSQMVSRHRLAQVAEELKIGEVLLLGKGEERSQGRHRPSNLANALEALFAAVFLDGGWEQAKRVIQKLFEPHWEMVLSEPVAIQNAKGVLQELLQRRGGESPVYRCLAEKGKAHERSYLVAVEWKGKELGRGWGRSKKEAETNAAFEALRAIEEGKLPDLPHMSLPKRK